MTQALYRKYRPTTFDQVIGQSHITTALKNQIINNNLSHAYIFNGTRGVGKTSIARIFARAINCQNNTNGNPCLECSSCLDYEKGGNIDIIEIDAASNNSVGFARELTERVGYVANNGKYKVYIIDEAHMITQQAFNALLKTLEEPPEHVIFILCTTEVQAFPATILSRCMRFDFRLVSAGEISTLLSGIFDDLSIKYTNQAVKAIATAGEGSVRDALTIADRCVAVCQDLDYQDVMDILGATNRDILISLSQQIIAGDVSGLLQTITSLSNLGKSMTMLTKDLCRHFRDLLIISTVSNSFDMLGLPQDLFDKLVSQTATTNSKKLMQAVETFAKLEYTLRTSLSPQILFEAVSARLATNSLSDDLDGLEIRVAQLEKKLSLLSVDFKELNKAIEFSQQTQSQQVISQQPQSQNQPQQSKPLSTTSSAVAVWSKILETVRILDSALLKTTCADVKKVEIVNNNFIMYCNRTQLNIFKDKTYSGYITKVLDTFNLRLELVLQEDSSGESGLDNIISLAGKNIEIK